MTDMNNNRTRTTAKSNMVAATPSALVAAGAGCHRMRLLIADGIEEYGRAWFDGAFWHYRRDGDDTPPAGRTIIRHNVNGVDVISGCERFDGDADDFFQWLLCNQYAEINLLA